MKYHLIFLISFLLLCSCKGQAFLEIDEITAEHKLYVIPIRMVIDRFGSKEELLISRGFVIENEETIVEINKEWGKKQIENLDFPFYKVLLTKNGTILRSLSINKELTILLTGHGFYKFKSELLFKHKNSFNYLDWMNIRTAKLTDAKNLLSELDKGNFIYPHFVKPKSDFREYQGNIIVKRKKISEEDNYQKIVQHDFELDSVFLRYTNHLGSDSVTLNFWTRQKFNTKIPKDYIVIDEWKEFENIEFEVIGCKKDIIETIINKMEINVELETAPNITAKNNFINSLTREKLVKLHYLLN